MNDKLQHKLTTALDKYVYFHHNSQKNCEVLCHMAFGGSRGSVAGILTGIEHWRMSYVRQPWVPWRAAPRFWHVIVLEGRESKSLHAFKNTTHKLKHRRTGLQAQIIPSRKLTFAVPGPCFLYSVHHLCGPQLQNQANLGSNQWNCILNVSHTSLTTVPWT